MLHKAFILLFLFSTYSLTIATPWRWNCTDNTNVVTNGSRILVSALGKHAKQVNCIYQCGGKCNGMTNGTHYWEFKLKKGHASFGFTTRDHLKNGTAVRGLFYDGGLNNGANKVPEDSKNLYNFGEEIKPNDKIGFLIDLTPKNMLVYIYHNKRCLGLAANFTAPYAVPLFPAFFVTDEAQVNIYESDGKPEKKQRKERKHTGIVGYWAITRCENQGKVVSTSNWKAYFFEVKPHTEQSTRVFTVLIKIVNEISVTLVNTADDLANGNWTLLQGGSSLGGTSGEAERAEEFMVKLFNNFQTLDFDDNSMIWSGKQCMKMVLKRQKSPIPDPLIRNPMQIG